MAEHSIIPAHDLASWLLSTIDDLLDFIGLRRYQSIEQIIYFAIIVAASYFIGWMIRKLIIYGTRKMVRLQNTNAGRELLEQRTFTRCSHFIPPLVFLSLAPFAFNSHSPILSIIIKLSACYLACMVAVGINAVLRFVFSRYNDKENTRNLPIGGILNVAMGIVWILAIIVCVSLLVDKSPTALLGGMTAFAAVLMLIFKDSILGCVAGVQMAQNDMLHVGDWIVVPNTPANGVVMDVSLTTVKVQNFDNTLVMVPPYTLVSTSYQNWRGMSESGARRIAQNIYVNPDSVKNATPEMIDDLCGKFPKLKSFVDNLTADKQTVAWGKGVAPLNGTIETNLGLFRAYITQYLLDNPMINKSFDLMTRVLDIDAKGVALQIYCFSVTTQWESYEAVLSAVMEYTIAMAPQFGLDILSSNELNVTDHTPAISQSAPAK